MSTGGTRATTSAAIAALGGLGLTSHGILADDLPRVVGGMCVTVAALLIATLVLVHSWIADTSDARKSLAAAQVAAERERSRYVAAQAALENEQGRLARDMAAERAAIAARLKAEREAMEAELEEKRATIMCEAFEAGVLMARGGKLTTDMQQRTANLIPFPTQQQERARAREHGVVGP